MCSHMRGKFLANLQVVIYEKWLPFSPHRKFSAYFLVFPPLFLIFIFATTDPLQFLALFRIPPLSQTPH